MHYLRMYHLAPLPPSLHQIELVQDHETLRIAFDGTNAERTSSPRARA